MCPVSAKKIIFVTLEDVRGRLWQLPPKIMEQVSLGLLEKVSSVFSLVRIVY